MATAIRFEGAGISFKRSLAKTTLKSIFMQGKLLKQGKFLALKDINFTVNHGEVFGVIGKNGAGKSTLLRLIGGIYHPTSGTVRVDGSVASLLSLGAGFQPELSGEENIMLNGLLLGLPKRLILSKMEEIVSFSELGEFIQFPVKAYSSGMVARLGFAVATHLRSDILLIDEILGVGDKDFKAKSKEKIKELITSGGTVVLVSHSLNEIKSFCKNVLWIEKGQQKMLGSAEEVVAAYEAS